MSKLPVIRKMQSKSTIRYHFSLSRITKMKTAGNNDYRKLKPHLLLARSEYGLKFLKKLNIKLSHDLAIPVLNIYTKEFKTYVYTQNMYMNTQYRLVWTKGANNPNVH